MQDKLICTLDGNVSFKFADDTFKDSLNLTASQDARINITNSIAPLVSIEFPDAVLGVNKVVKSHWPNFAKGTVKDLELNHGQYDVELVNGDHVKYGSASTLNKFNYNWLLI
jgi:hypothetical protein